MPASPRSGARPARARLDAERPAPARGARGRPDAAPAAQEAPAKDGGAAEAKRVAGTRARASVPDAARDGAKEREKAARTYTITELAQEFDITPRAIRFYEDVGLLTPARAGRNRVYTPGDRTRLKLTMRSKRLGLSLNEIRQLVHMYDSEADERPQLEAFLVVLQEHRVQLEQQRDDIQVTLEEIAQHEERCRRLIAAAGRPVAAPARRARGTR